MSELIQTHDNRATIRWKLLTGASVLALTAYVSSTPIARAADADRPSIWLELDGQLSRLQNGQEIYAPPFLASTPSIFSPPQSAERPPLYGIDQGASISFQPEGSNWIFSGSIRYGRSGTSKHTHHQTYPQLYHKYARICYFGSCITSPYNATPDAARFTDARVKQSETHTIIDFQAGKDLGLGLFGHNASSTISAGIRFAQFNSKSRVSLGEDPDWRIAFYSYHVNIYNIIIETNQYTRQTYHTFAGSFRADRTFHGVGPSLSWKSSVPFAGNPNESELTLDWGVNAALLFGRQKTTTHHQTTGRYNHDRFQYGVTHVTTHVNPPSQIRSRSVTVPNVGGFAGISLNWPNAKISLGYRADWFFNALDGGIDATRKENRAFHGPYASISIGLGD